MPPLARSLLGLVLCLAAAPAWLATLDQPLLRKSGAAAWLLLAVGLVLAFSAMREAKRAWAGGVFALCAALAGLVIWGAAVPARVPGAKAGALAQAPDFELESTDGKRLSPADWRGKGPVLLVFFRGCW
jgi:hypothetical protein